MDKLRKGSKNLMKDINRSSVVNYIRTMGPVSRTEVASLTGLSLSTITKVTDDLINEKMIFEVGEGVSSGGRKPILLAFNESYGYVVGVKIEEKRVIFALTNLRGEIVERYSLSFENGEAEVVLDMMVGKLREIESEVLLQGKRFMGIGVAVSGLVNRKTGELIFSTMLGWEKVDLGQRLYQEFSVPVYVDNNVNAYALAEMWFGYGRKRSNFLCVSFGVGVGAGIVIDGKIYRGHLGGAGEVGHMVVEQDGLQCHCGQKGCLEAYASTDNLLAEVKGRVHPGSVLYDKSDLELEDLVEALSLGEDYVVGTIDRAGGYLRTALVSLINTFNPSAVILAGEGMVLKEHVMPYIDQAANENFFSKHKKARIFVSELGADAWEIGAALLVITNLFEVPIYSRKKGVQ